MNEDVRECQKKLTQVESDLGTNKNKLEEAIKQLEEREKSLTAVSSQLILIRITNKYVMHLACYYIRMYKYQFI